jgi:hypothetical protein
MRNTWSVVLSASLLTLAPCAARPAEPTPSTLPPASGPAQPASDGLVPGGPAASTPSAAPTGAASHPSNMFQFLAGQGWHGPASATAAPCATCCDNGCCTEDCGKRQRKVARFLDWLIYRPLDGGKTKCCHCQSEPPPAWAFFPCEKGSHCGCSAVAGQGPLYYAKEAGTTAATQTVQTAYPPNTVQPPPPPPAPAAPPPPAAPQKQGGIA